MTPLARVVALAVVVGLIFVAIGFASGSSTDSRSAPAGTVTTPTTATVELAPNGMAYCPADPATPHPTPCVNP